MSDSSSSLDGASIEKTIRPADTATASSAPSDSFQILPPCKVDIVIAADVGTTGLKTTLVSRDGVVLAAVTHRYAHGTITSTNGSKGDVYVEQQPEDWVSAFSACIADLSSTHASKLGRVVGIVLSGQMQDLILVDEQGLALRPAVLYSDARARAQAEHIESVVVGGAKALKKQTGNWKGPVSLLPKLMWMSEHEPEKMNSAKYILLSAHGYLAVRLGGCPVCDHVSASTTGLLRADNGLEYCSQLIEQFISADIASKLAPLLSATKSSGVLSARQASKLGLSAGLPIYHGCGDLAATTMGAGAGMAGVPYMYVGTSGWVAMSEQTSADARQQRQKNNAFVVSHPGDAKLHIAAASCMTAGGNIEWLHKLNLLPSLPSNSSDDGSSSYAVDVADQRQKVKKREKGKQENQWSEEKEENQRKECMKQGQEEEKEKEGKGEGEDGDRFAAMEADVASSEPGAGGCLFLPWLAGERSPMSDPNARACFLGISPTTSRTHMTRAVYEGVAFSYRALRDQVLGPDWWCGTIRDNVGDGGGGGSSSINCDGDCFRPCIRAIGGGTKSKVWMQIMADVLACDIIILADTEHVGALGAVSLVAESLGWTKPKTTKTKSKIESSATTTIIAASSATTAAAAAAAATTTTSRDSGSGGIASAMTTSHSQSGIDPSSSSNFVRVERTVKPSSDHAIARYNAIYAVYSDTYAALAPLFPRLAAAANS